MKSLSFHRILVAALSSVVLMAGGSAHAAFRSYISVNGNDANACTLVAPCRLLPAALATTDPGGEVWMLDSGNFNTGPVDVTKSVTILAIPGALGSVIALNGDAIVVNTAGVSVTLRNLVIRSISNGGHGINFSQGTRVIVEGCEIYGLPLDGVHATAPNGTVTVKETTIRQNGGAGVYLSGIFAGNVLSSKVMHNNFGVNIENTGRTYIIESVITNANVSAVAITSSGTFTRVVIDYSVVKNANISAIDVVANAGSGVNLTVARSTVADSNIGINVSGAGNAAVALDGNVIAHHNAGVNLNNSATAMVQTRNNNTFIFNTGSQNVINGVLTSLGAL